MIDLPCCAEPRFELGPARRLGREARRDDLDELITFAREDRRTVTAGAELREWHDLARASRRRKQCRHGLVDRLHHDRKLTRKTRRAPLTRLTHPGGASDAVRMKALKLVSAVGMALLGACGSS